MDSSIWAGSYTSSGSRRRQKRMRSAPFGVKSRQGKPGSWARDSHASFSLNARRKDVHSARHGTSTHVPQQGVGLPSRNPRYDFAENDRTPQIACLFCPKRGSPSAAISELNLIEGKNAPAPAQLTYHYCGFSSSVLQGVAHFVERVGKLPIADLLKSVH